MPTPIKYRNAAYCENGWINCEINHPQFGWIPFTCNPDDEHPPFDAKELFERMVADGNVAAYVAPTFTDEQIAAGVRLDRDQRLKALDEIVSNPLRWAAFESTVKTALASYRQALLDVPNQDGFPRNVVWPVAPK